MSPSLSEVPVSHELDGVGAAEQDFLRRYPKYRRTAHVDMLRRTEYGRLDQLGHTYLDYTGGGLYAESQLRCHYDLLSERVLGNPHSNNPTSAASAELAAEARAAVLRYFNAVDEDYEVIFCANASAALKLVGEAYPFRPGAVFLLSYDNHNSVNGIREFARRKGATVAYVPVRQPHLRLDEGPLRRALKEKTGAGPDRLFAYPAQSNFSGVQHPLDWVAEAQALGWDVLLDCAAYVPTNRLDLEKIKPDYVVLSFYKMFGYPTGIGALLARREKLAKLDRPWFAGGTLTIASVQGEGWFHLAPGAAAFEDGTIDYLGLPAITIGLRHLERIGIETIHTRTHALAGWLLEELQLLRHDNGAPVIRIFGPTDMARRGAALALHLLDPSGCPYDVYDVEAAAGRQRISIRTGCFCNPGTGEVAHDITPQDLRCYFEDPQTAMSRRQYMQAIEDATGKVLDTVRVSLGVASTFADVYRFLVFAAAYRNRPAA
jgi:molybdenum cofactor sulfurtransferase